MVKKLLVIITFDFQNLDKDYESQTTDLLRKEDLLDAELEQIKNTLDKEMAELEKLKTEYVILIWNKIIFNHESKLISSHSSHLNVLCLIEKLFLEPSQIFKMAFCKSIFRLYTTRKRQKIFVFLIFSGGIDMEFMVAKSSIVDVWLASEYAAE